MIDQHPSFQLKLTKRYLLLKWVENGLVVLHSDSTDLDSFELVTRND